MSKKPKSDEKGKQQQEKTFDKGKKVKSQAELMKELMSEEEQRGAGALEYPTHENLETVLNEAESKVAESQNQLMRTQAELENMRRRAERDVANAHKFALEKFVLELLPVVDSLEQALQDQSTNQEKSSTIREGIKLTLNMFLKTMEKFGVVQIDPQGEAFNPDLHEAISIQEDPDVAPNTVLKILQKGYTLNGRLVRPALVIVAK